MFILIFGWAFSDPGIKTFEIGLVVSEGSYESGSIITESMNHVVIDDDNVFEVEVMERDLALDQLQDGNIDAVIVIPENMDNSIDASEAINLDIYYDPSQASRQQILVPILGEVIDQIDRSSRAPN